MGLARERFCFVFKDFFFYFVDTAVPYEQDERKLATV
jgi:hypothetical protein